MSTFSLRPVSHSDGSSSPGTSTASDRSPPPREPRAQFSPSSPVDASRPRRPLSPSSLRDLDLSLDHNVGPRKYPAPPTGHELMALFPPAPPLAIYSGPTSGFFQREERAFFAQAGKEIVRVHIEVDLELKEGESNTASKPRPRDGASHTMSRPYPPANPSLHPHLHPPPQLSPNEPSPASYPHPRRTSRSGPVAVTTQPVFPVVSHTSPPSPFPPNIHPSPNTQHAGSPLQPPSHERPHHPVDGGEALADEFRDDPDEAWRRPTPHNQRRRAGKHTKRVVVRS